MSTTVKTGWLHDKNGDKFAPKTLISQVQTSDGILLEDKIQSDLDTAKEDILANVSIDVDTALSSTSTNPVQNKVIDAEFDAMSDAMGALELAIDSKANSSHSHDDRYYTEAEVDALLEGKSDSNHNHNSVYDTKGSADDALASAKEYTNTKTSGLASTATVENAISTHSTSTSAHNDIRVLIADLTEKLNAFLDVDDATTDQLSEVLALINNNKGTLESLTTNKINVSDIVNNLTTNSTSKVLSAAQGVMIKGLIDALDAEIDTKADSGHTHTITASASDDDVVVLTGTNGTNGVTYSASHANSGVTAGTYKSVTVNAKGHVTGGTNPTTLAGYGITDAYTKTDMDGALAGKSNTGHTHSISNITNLQNTLNSKVDLSSNQTVGGNKVFTGTTSTMVLHTYNPLYINNGSDNSKNTSLYTSDSNTFAITSSANNMTFNGENVAMMSDVDSAVAQKTQVQIITWGADD